MNRRTSLSIAYYLVTTGFTLGLFGLLFFLPPFFGNKNVRTTNTDIAVQLRSGQDIFEVIEGSKRLWRSEIDTTPEWQIRKSSFNGKSVIQLPFSYLQSSSQFGYYFQAARFIIEYLAWLYIAYQLFLILYDAKRKIVFNTTNIRRMRKIGFSFLLLFVLFLVSFKYRGTVRNGQLWIDAEWSIKIFGGYIQYLLIASLVFAFAAFFNEGKQMKEEAELTV